MNADPKSASTNPYDEQAAQMILDDYAMQEIMDTLGMSQREVIAVSLRLMKRLSPESTMIEIVREFSRQQNKAEDQS